MYNKVEICGVNTAKLTVMKEKEKRELLALTKKGDLAAQDALVNGNLRLVLSVIQRFTNRGENLDDLFQIGCIGLIKAIKNFDLSLGLRFSTYACPMIIGEIRRYLRDNTSLRVSRTLRDTAYKAMHAKEVLQNKLGREPKAEEIAQFLGISRQSVAVALEAIVEPVSLYEPVHGEGNDTIYVLDQVKDKNGEESWIYDIFLRDTMKNMSEREKRIVSLRFMAGKTQVEVAQEIGISQAQVSRIEKTALDRIKNDNK